jgi:hypothetical protein
MPVDAQYGRHDPLPYRPRQTCPESESQTATLQVEIGLSCYTGQTRPDSKASRAKLAALQTHRVAQGGASQIPRRENMCLVEGIDAKEM